MFLLYGTYKHPSGEVTVSIRREALLTSDRFQYGVREHWVISGFLQAATPALLTTAIERMTQAYAVNYRPIGLFNDDGSQTAHSMTGVSTLGGTVVIRQPMFPEGKGAEYSTFRSYEIEIEGIYPLIGTAGANILLEFDETLDFTGGGPRFVYLQPVSGPVQRQQVASATPFRCTQHGAAKGLYSYPPVPDPLWPLDEHRDQRRISRRHPHREWAGGNPVYTGWEVTWSYEFESSNILLGTPNLWE
jgi:hypothetical protein